MLTYLVMLTVTVEITMDRREDSPHYIRVCEVIARNDWDLVGDFHFFLDVAILLDDSETKPKTRQDVKENEKMIVLSYKIRVI